MSLPKGFGRNYFTLNAITATSNQMSLHAIVSRVHDFHLKQPTCDELEEEQDEELDLLEFQELNAKACHCNCHFLKCTKKALKLCHSQNKFFNYFKTLNNSISPPCFV